MFITLKRACNIPAGPESFGFSQDHKEVTQDILIKADSIIQLTPLKKGTEVIYASGSLKVKVVESAKDIVALIEEVSSQPNPPSKALSVPRSSRHPS